MRLLPSSLFERFANSISLRLRSQSYWVLKVHINTLSHSQELEVYQHLAGVTLDHPGREHIRQLQESFKLTSRYGEHDIL